MGGTPSQVMMWWVPQPGPDAGVPQPGPDVGVPQPGPEGIP